MMTNQRLAEINGEMIKLLIAVKDSADAAFVSLEDCESASQGYDVLKATVDAVGNAVVNSPYYTREGADENRLHGSQMSL